MTRILIVEDEQSLSEPLAFLLGKEGYEVEVAADGPSALSAFDRAPADLVLLDLMLPGRGGLEILSALREQGLETPVVVLTARDATEDRVLGLDAGAGGRRG